MVVVVFSDNMRFESVEENSDGHVKVGAIPKYLNKSNDHAAIAGLEDKTKVFLSHILKLLLKVEKEC